jgi:DNA-directed RNA polymerase subunit N (RpoN/RPB10)
MSDPIRCFSTNSAIGEYYMIYVAIRDHLNRHPPGQGDKTLVDYLREFGITQYPQIMRMTSHVRFIDAHTINRNM